MPVPAEPELLLRHSAWVRALAVDLVGEQSRADDVVQETWLAALRSQRTAGNERRWLGAVARNAARMAMRGEARRARREADAARGEALPSAAESVERLALQRRVAEAVLALDSPARELVTLRYYEDLPPREIARRLGLSPANVHTRLSRARAALRARLERDFADERRAWGLLLAGAPPLASKPTWIGALLMNSALKWSAAALAVLLLAMAVQRFVLRSSALEPGERAAESALEPGLADTSPAAPSAEPAEDETERGALVANAPAPPAPVEVVATPSTGAVVVRVRRRSDGAPADGIGLRVVAWDQPDLWFHQRSKVTDAEGLARFEDVPPGQTLVYISRLSGENFFGAEEVQVEPGGEHEVAFEVVPGLTIEGRVVDFAGRAVPDAAIWLGDGAGPPWGGEVVTRSDAEGAFVIRHASSMQGVAARAEGYAPSRALLPRDPGKGFVELELVLPALGGALEGAVVDVEGRPLADALVLVGDAEFGRTNEGDAPPSWDPPPVRLRTDERGRFHANGVAAGEVPVRARARGHAAGEALALVPAGGLGEVRLVLEQGATLSGRVTYPGGAPAAEAEVEAAPADGGRGLGRTRAVTDEAGRFELVGVPVGELVLTAATADGLLSVEARLETRPGEVARWEAVLPETLPLAGSARDSGGLPLAGWRVARRLESPGGASAMSRGTATDADGRFRFERCPLGRYTLELRAPGQWVGEPVARLEGVEPGGEEPALVVPADQVPRASVFGRVVDDAGEAVSGASVSLRSRGETFVATHAQAGADGRFAFEFLPAQAYTLNVSADGHEPLAALEVEELGEREARDLGALELREAD